MSTDVVSQIMDRQSKLRRAEGSSVLLKVEIGVMLNRAKKERREKEKDWEEYVEKAFGYNRREASSLIRIGNEWGAEIGTRSSDFLALLPGSTSDLAILSRLRLEEVEELAERTDLRQRSANDLRKEVQHLCPPPNVEKALEDCLSSLTAWTEKLDTAVDARAIEKARKALGALLNLLEPRAEEEQASPATSLLEPTQPATVAADAFEEADHNAPDGPPVANAVGDNASASATEQPEIVADEPSPQATVPRPRLRRADPMFQPGARTRGRQP